MEYNGKYGHTIGRIQHIALVSRIEIWYATCRLVIQTMATTITGFHRINICVQYLDIHQHKLIFYTSNSYDGSNVIRLTGSWN